MTHGHGQGCGDCPGGRGWVDKGEKVGTPVIAQTLKHNFKKLNVEKKIKS